VTGLEPVPMGGGERFGGQVPQVQGGAEDRRERIRRMRDRGPEKPTPQMGCMGGEDPPIGYWHRL
jgi:hypothetical protein